MQTTRTLDRGTNSEDRSRIRAIGANLIVVGALGALAALALLILVALEVPLDIAIRYPMAKTVASTQGEEARRFIGYVTSPAGQAVLAKYGFQKL